MKRTDKRPGRHRTRKSLTAIGLLAIGASVSLAHLPEAQAYQVAITNGDQATLEQFLRDHPTSSFAPDVIGRLSFGTHKTDTAVTAPMQLASNAGGNGGGHGGGNGNGHGGGGGQSGSDSHGGGGSQGGSGGESSDSDAAGSDGSDSPNNGHANGGNGHFHGPNDDGRPDMFGDPGKPEIGAPGLSGY